MMPTNLELREILEVGIKAISTCNHQPWRFNIIGDELHVHILRTKNFFLKLEGNTWIELGTVLENIITAAKAKGYGISYRLQECCGLDEPAAIVTFAQGQPSAVDIEPLLRRTTNREAYSEEPLSRHIEASIYHACDLPGINIKILTKRRKNQCAEILSRLENVRMANRLMLEEVVPYIRIDEKEIAEKRDRLDVKTMSLSQSALIMLKFAKKNPKVASFFYALFNRLGLISKQTFEKNLIKSGAIISFLLEERTQQAYVNLGRVAQRVLNQLTVQNVQTNTMVSGLYLLDLLKENLEIYSKREQALLLRYQYDLQSLFDFTDNRIALFIRAGYAKAPQFRSFRKNVDDLMIDMNIFKTASRNNS